jgi:hypothetical protein
VGLCAARRSSLISENVQPPVLLGSGFSATGAYSSAYRWRAKDLGLLRRENYYDSYGAQKQIVSA